MRTFSSLRCVMQSLMRCFLRLTRMKPIVTLLLLVTLLEVLTLHTVQAGETDRAKLPPRLEEAVGCLVAAEFVRQYDLTYLV